MPRTGTGIYNLPAGQPVVTGTTISSTTFNTLTADLATALTSSLASDGQTVPTANIQLGGFKLTNVGAGSATTDGATIGGAETLSNKRVQLGGSATATQNFTLTAEAADGTMKLARGNAGATTQDVITVDAAGKVAFPQMAQSLNSAGYIKLPGGLIVQWGAKANDNGLGGGFTLVTYPIAFPNAAFNVSITPNTSSGISYANKRANINYGSETTTGFSWIAYNSDGSIDITASSVISWIAIGY